MTTRKHTLPRTPWSADSHWKPTLPSLCVLTVALLLFGIGDGFLILSALGSTPWSVLAQGVSLTTGLHIGWTSFFISVAVMLTWLPFKQKPGLGTILNITLIAVGLGFTVSLVPAPSDILIRILFMLLGILLIGIASAFYLTCHMGPGPRDGLMVGLYQATGWKIGAIRSLIEATVCFIGWLLGGVLGVGTLLFAFGVGWVLQGTLTVLAKKYQKS